jgi:tetratricopeptide (TPR) repeat protein
MRNPPRARQDAGSIRIVGGMPEPVSTGLKGAQVGYQLARAAKAWLEPRDTTERLLYLVAMSLSERTDGALGYPELLAWWSDDAFARELAALLDPDRQVDRNALAAAILPLVARPDPQTSAQQFAQEIAQLFLNNVVFAERGDGLVRRLYFAQAQVVPGPVRYLELDWAPARAREELETLAATSKDEAAALQDALAGRDIGTALRPLVRAPQPWLDHGSAALWSVVARLAETTGNWDVARIAWKSAADRPGVDQVRAVLREGRAAEQLGDPEGWRAALDFAQKLDDAHPLVAVELAREEPDVERALQILGDAREPGDSEQVASVEAYRAVLEGALGRFDEAEQIARRALDAAPQLLPAKEAAAGTVLLRARSAWTKATPVPLDSCRNAARIYVELMDDLRAARAFADSGEMRVRAAELLTLCRDRAEALALLQPDGFREDERDVDDVVAQAGGLAMMLDDYDLALRWLTEERATTPRARALRAAALMRQSADKLEPALALLEDQIERHGDYESAVGRLLAAAAGPTVDWHERAANIVAEQSPASEALLRAHHLLGRDDWEAAQEALLAHPDDIRIQGMLLGLFQVAPNHAAAVAHARALLAMKPSWELRMASAEALWDGGEADEARAVFEAVARETGAPLDHREEAYRELCARLAEAGRYEEALGAADEWLKIDPDAVTAGWFRVYILHRLARWTRAREGVDDLKHAPAQLQEAQLVADIRLHAGELDAAVAGLADYADGLPEPNPQLESDLARTARFAGEHLAAELRERLSQRAGEPAPDAGPRVRDAVPNPAAVAARQRQAVQAMMAGERHVGTVASTMQHSMAETFARLKRLPMLGADGIPAAEVDAARAALGAGAVVVTGALNTLALLDGELAATVVSRVPRAVLAQAVLDDASKAHLDLLYSQRGHATPQLLTRVERIAALAGMLRAEPDIDARKPSSSDDVLGRQPVDGPTRVAVSSLGLAERTGFPLWCDDRVLRRSADEHGTAGFSTAALLVALDGRGAFDAAARQSIDRALSPLGVSVFGES